MDSSQKSEQKLPDLIVILGVMIATIIASRGIFFFTRRFEVGLGGLLSLLVLMLVIENIPRTKPYGGAIRLGMLLGIFGSGLLESWLLK